MAKIVVRVYRAKDVNIGPIKVRAYILEKEISTSGDFFDVYTDTVERYKNTEGVIVEVVGYSKDGKEEYVAIYTVDKGKLLFQRPAKLKKVVLIDEKQATTLSPQPLNRMASYTPSEDVYVYLGEIASEKPVWGVLVETDKGSRLVKLAK